MVSRNLFHLLRIARVFCKHGLDEFVSAIHLFRPYAFLLTEEHIQTICNSILNDYYMCLTLLNGVSRITLFTVKVNRH